MPPLLRLPGEIDPAWSRIPDACICAALRMLSRHASRPLDRVLAGHGVSITEFQLMLILQERPARALELARRLRLDPAPTGRSLARLEERGVVRRELRWRFAPWILEPRGAAHLELLEPAWHDVNELLRGHLGCELVTAVIRRADDLPNTVPREHQGWFD
jgi:hypothetical protein